jgi:hypothetical protein
MSQGLGLPWLKKYTTDVYPKDQVISNGRKAKPPRYYDKHLEQWQPEKMEKIKAARALQRQHMWKHSTPRAREAKEATVKARLNLKQKGL